jgi:predicted nucleic acid-binding Zn ribbon protein
VYPRVFPTPSSSPLVRGRTRISPTSKVALIFPVMAFDSLQHIIGGLQKQQSWQEHQRFQHLLRCWSEVVGAVVAQQTRPIHLSPRGVLKVATSSSVWAQNLTFERQRILAKLNQNLPQPLTDLHFSTAYWTKEKPPLPETTTQSIFSSTQFTRSTPVAPKLSVVPDDPNLAFQGWAKAVQSRSRQLPLCPQCHCPTPQLELDRWSCCGLCAARH